MSMFGNLGLVWAFTRAAHLEHDPPATTPEPGDREGLVIGPAPHEDMAAGTTELRALRAAHNTDNWCVECGWHRAQVAGGKCPSCLDEEKRRAS